jgi:hypothetical protein
MNFSAGQFTTHGQSHWNIIPTARNVLDDNLAVVYASQGARLVVGDTANFELLFSSPLAVENYLPALGNPGILTTSLLDPTLSGSGVFGGDVVALTLDVDSSAGGLLAHPAGISFGDLYLTGYDGTSVAGLDGKTVSQLLAIDNRALGDGISDFSIDDLNLVSNPLGAAFTDGQITNFSCDHLTSTNPNGGGNPIVTPRAVEPTSVGRAAGGGNAPLLVAPPFQPEIFHLNQNIAPELCASGLLVPGC